MNSYRKYITSGVAFSFLVVGSTGLFLKFFFKNHPIENIHTWLGISMVALGTIHVFQNRLSMFNHLKEKKVFYLLIPIVIVILGFSLFEVNEEKGLNPRIVMQNLIQSKLVTVAEVLKKDPRSVLIKMQQEGLDVTGPDQTLEEIAKINRKVPREMLKFFQ